MLKDVQSINFVSFAGYKVREYKIFKLTQPHREYNNISKVNYDNNNSTSYNAAMS